LPQSLKHVLVVDDDPDLLAVVSLSLTALGGYAVDTCGTAADALDMVRRGRPDLVMLDNMMPGQNGLAVLSALRAAPDIGTTPVVLMSAQIDHHQIARYESLGFLGVIPKPFDPVALPEVLEELWKVHHRRRVEVHQKEFESLRRAYIDELGAKMDAMKAAAATLATEGWNRSVLESLAHMTHRIAGSSGLYRLDVLCRSAGALEEILKRLLDGPTWPPPSPPGDVARLVQAVSRAPRTGGNFAWGTRRPSPRVAPVASSLARASRPQSR
jgi:two-component system OmpR family response regulator